MSENRHYVNVRFYETARSTILNKLVHSDFANRYRPEVEDAIFDVDYLRRHLQDVKSGKFKKLCHVRELILRLVKYKEEEERRKETKGRRA